MVPPPLVDRKRWTRTYNNTMSASYLGFFVLFIGIRLPILVVEAVEWNGQVIARVDEFLDYSMRVPINMVRRAQTYLRIGGFRGRGTDHNDDAALGLEGSHRATTIPWLRMEDLASLYYGLEDGTFLNYNDDFTWISYREPGNSGYNVADIVTGMNSTNTNNLTQVHPLLKHYESCVDRYNGAEESCDMDQVGAKYVKCQHDSDWEDSFDGNCPLGPCPVSVSSLSGGTSSPDTDLLCPQYTVEEVRETERLGFVPRTYSCCDPNGAYEQGLGKVQIDKDGTLGSCYYEDGVTPVDRQLSGQFAQCGYQEMPDGSHQLRECSTTFVGGYRSRDYDPRVRVWYVTTKEQQRPYWHDPYPFFSENVMGITYSEPFYEQIELPNNNGGEGSTASLFRGVWAVDFHLAWISDFLQENYQDLSTDESIAVLLVESSGPDHFVVATSTGSPISKLVRSDDPAEPCGDAQSSECTAARVPLADLQGHPDDKVLKAAFYAQQKAGFPTSQLVTFQTENGKQGSPAYNCESKTFEVAKDTNLQWHIIAAMPMGYDTKSEATRGTGAFVVIAALATIGFVTCWAMFLVFIRYRDEELVQFVDWRFTCAFLFLCAVLNLSSFTLLGRNTDVTCMLRMWSFNLLFAATLSPLFVKVYRMYVLVKAGRSFRKTKVSHMKALMMTLPIVVVELLILILFTILDPPRAVEELGIGPGSGLQRVTCSADTNGFFIAQTVYNAVLILVGCFLAYKTRNLEERFCEANQLGLAMYNIAFTGTLFLIMTEVIKMDPIHQKVLRTMGVLWGTVFSSLVFPLPRLLQVEEKKKRPTSVRSIPLGLVDGEQPQVVSRISRIEQSSKEEPQDDAT